VLLKRQEVRNAFCADVVPKETNRELLASAQDNSVPGNQV
jgi:hypothetical protein